MRKGTNLAASVIVVFLTLLFSSVCLHAKIPEGFSLLSDHSGLKTTDSPKISTRSVSRWRPSSVDRQRGFAACAIDTSANLNPGWLWSEKTPLQTLDSFACRGQYKALAVAVRTLTPVQGFTAVTNDLSTSGGHKISKDNIDVRLVQYGGLANWLEKPFPKDMPSDWTAWLWITVYTPEDATPGLYTSNLTLKDSVGNSLTLPIRLRVLDFDMMHCKGSYGLYLTSHFYSDEAKGIYANYASNDGWESKNLELYFKYWKTRGLNSPAIFFVYPDLKYIDGKVVADYPNVRDFAEAMKKTGLDGELCVDLRWVAWWSDTVAVKLNKLKASGKEPQGDLGIYGWNSTESPWEYTEESKEIFKDAVRQLLDYAKKENWPPLLVFTEEELWIPTVKTIAYDHFNPALLEVAPDRTFLIDDAIGYGDENAIDRGARDNLRIRQYNNWTEEGLAIARKQGAQVRSYNNGFLRAAVGMYNQRIGSTGYHQWADHFGDRVSPLNSSTSTMIRPDGIVSSVQIERLREGIDDYSYFNTLSVLVDKLEKNGLAKDAQAARKVLAGITADIPVYRYAFLDWVSIHPSSKLDQRVWKVVLAIQKARQAFGQKVQSFEALAGSPAIVEVFPVKAKKVQAEKLLNASRLTEPISLDGNANEQCWKKTDNSTGKLWWTWKTESLMRARAGSFEKFKQNSSASNAYSSIAYNDRGLYIQLHCDDLRAQNAKVKYLDDDPDLSKDDCMEFYFQTGKSSGSYHHMIVNANGRKVFMSNGTVINNNGIKTATIGPDESQTGYDQEIFIPWKAFGLESTPADGSAWKLQVGRQFQSWKGKYSPEPKLTCWAQVKENFNEKDKWGTIVFAGSDGEVWISDLDLGTRYPGKNVARGSLSLKEEIDSHKFIILLTDENNKVVGKKLVPRKGVNRSLPFKLMYEVPSIQEPVRWALKVLDDKKQTLFEKPVPIPVTQQSLKIIECMSSIVSGYPLSVDFEMRVGEFSLSDCVVKCALISASGKRVALDVPAISGKELAHRAVIDTTGLKPCIWSLELWLDKHGVTLKGDSAEIEVMPSPVGKI